MSVIMAYLDEGDEPLETVNSIFETTPPGFVEIIAIDDCSGQEKSADISGIPGVRVFRNEKRKGLFACKDFAVEQARAPYLMIIDAHMRFKPDYWATKMMFALRARPETAFCTTCLGLGWKGGKTPDEPRKRDINTPNGRYHGATLVIKRPKRRKGAGMEFIEPKWQGRETELIYDLPCILGANYGITRAWWQKIRGLKGLRMWGGQEAFLSLKTWQAGGRCAIIRDIEIGHLFRSRTPYVASYESIWYNKMRMALSVLPRPIGDPIHRKIAADHPKAAREIEADMDEITADREYYDSIFVPGAFEEFRQRFKIECHD